MEMCAVVICEKRNENNVRFSYKEHAGFFKRAVWKERARRCLNMMLNKYINYGGIMCAAHGLACLQVPGVPHKYTFKRHVATSRSNLLTMNFCITVYMMNTYRTLRRSQQFFFFCLILINVNECFVYLSWELSEVRK